MSNLGGDERSPHERINGIIEFSSLFGTDFIRFIYASGVKMIWFFTYIIVETNLIQNVKTVYNSLSHTVGFPN